MMDVESRGKTSGNRSRFLLTRRETVQFQFLCAASLFNAKKFHLPAKQIERDSKDGLYGCVRKAKKNIQHRRRV